MEENKQHVNEDIYSKVLRAGRRTYFFDVRSTKAGDYYLTISESKKFTNEDGTFYFKKHKIYLYKEDFENFSNILPISIPRKWMCISTIMMLKENQDCCISG